MITACDKSILSNPLFSPCFLKFTCLLSYHLSLPPLPPPTSHFFHPCHPLPRLCLLFSATLSHSRQAARLTWLYCLRLKRTRIHRASILVLCVTSAAAHLKSWGALRSKLKKLGIQADNHLHTTEESRSISHPVKQQQLVTFSEQQPLSSRLNETIEQMALCDLDLNS